MDKQKFDKPGFYITLLEALNSFHLYYCLYASALVIHKSQVSRNDLPGVDSYI